MVPIVLVMPLVSAGAVAITGHEASALFGLVGLPGLVLIAWQNQRGDWDLNRAERAVVWDTNLSGQPSGDPHLDAIAAYQLEQAGRSRTADKLFLAVLLLAAATAPVAAALRTGNPWWLLALLASASLAVLVAPVLNGDTPADRLHRLNKATLIQEPATPRGASPSRKRRSA